MTGQKHLLLECLSITIWRNLNVTPYFGRETRSYPWSRILIYVWLGRHNLSTAPAWVVEGNSKWSKCEIKLLSLGNPAVSPVCWLPSKAWPRLHHLCLGWEPLETDKKMLSLLSHLSPSTKLFFLFFFNTLTKYFYSKKWSQWLDKMMKYECSPILI